MMRVYHLTSDYSAVPLAEIRSDGNKIDFIVDNTDGALPKQTGNEWAKLLMLVERSSHLKLKEAEKPTAHLMRYVMDNGDVVEMSTDGMTCILNGKFMDEHQKKALFHAMKLGEIKVARKSTESIPHLVSSTKAIAPKVKKPKSDPAVIAKLQEINSKREAREANYTKHNDPDIRKMDLSWSDDPEFSRALINALKYGN